MIAWEKLLIDGLLLCLAFGLLVVSSLAINPRIWLQDYPAEIRRLAPPLSPEEKRQQRIFMIPFLFIFLVVPGLLAAALPDSRSFWTVFSYVALLLNLLNLFDAVVLDYLFLTLLRPSFAIIPEARGREEAFSIGLQVRNFFKGVVLCTVLALPIAGVVTLVHSFV